MDQDTQDKQGLQAISILHHLHHHLTLINKTMLIQVVVPDRHPGTHLDLQTTLLPELTKTTQEITNLKLDIPDQSHLIQIKELLVPVQAIPGKQGPITQDNLKTFPTKMDKQQDGPEFLTQVPVTPVLRV